MVLRYVMVPEQRHTIKVIQIPSLFGDLSSRVSGEIRERKKNNHIAEESNNTFCKHMLRIVMKLRRWSLQLSWFIWCATFIFSNSIQKKTWPDLTQFRMFNATAVSKQSIICNITRTYYVTARYHDTYTIQTMLISLMMYSKKYKHTLHMYHHFAQCERPKS